MGKEPVGAHLLRGGWTGLLVIWFFQKQYQGVGDLTWLVNPEMIHREFLSSGEVKRLPEDLFLLGASLCES